MKMRSFKTSGVPIRVAAAGFTLVELVAVLIVVGILAIFVTPHFFDRQTYDARTGYDTSLSMLRYAQKVAIAQHAKVFVVFNGNAASLCFDLACGSHVLTPTNAQAEFVLPTGASGTTFYFNALGKPFRASDIEPNSNFAKTTFVLPDGGRTITIEAETGYVH